ncbi:phosphate transporter [Anaeramoeba ignava]|uniref:Phosphate transporter n=1 Tax=Anaeramoeba ignava TaxID=1746090 RepID=A0A9Q0R8W6_ANAIG|nr:phosphate transporter [Anaeramoeba ignava]
MGVLLFFLIFGAICAFLMAFGIGMNDAANSFGTAVGSKALTIKKALSIGSLFELVGALLIGGFVSQTLRKGIVDPAYFENDQLEFALGMLSALFGSTAWLFLATYWALPVSTTHSIVGGILGFALYKDGTKAVNSTSLINIILSWVISPVSGFVVSWLMFKIMNKTIFNKKNDEECQKASKKWTPIHFGFTIAVMVLFFFESVVKSLKIKLAVWLLIVIFIVSWLISWFICYKWILNFYLKKEEKISDDSFNIVDPLNEFGMLDSFEIFGDIDLHLEKYVEYNVESDELEKEEFHYVIQPEFLPEIPINDRGWKTMSEDSFLTEFSDKMDVNNLRMNLEKIDLNLKSNNQKQSDSDSEIELENTNKFIELKNVDRDQENKLTKKPSDLKEQEDESPYKKEIQKLGKTVPLFMLLQIITSLFVAFGHGGNNVPNATAPFGSIMAVYKSGTTTQVNVSYWILALGGAALSLGLLFFGSRVLLTVGEKITLLTPAGGYIAQLSTALTTVVCSRLGMPISTTHILIGAVMGYGVSLYGWKTGINGKMIFKIIVSWLVTLPIAGFTAIMIFAILRPLCD